MLRRVQRRREWPVRLTQAVQLQIQKRVIASVLADAGRPPRLPAPLRWAVQFRAVRNVPARFIGYGVRQEQVHTSLLHGAPLRASPTEHDRGGG